MDDSREPTVPLLRKERVCFYLGWFPVRQNERLSDTIHHGHILLGNCVAWKYTCEKTRNRRRHNLGSLVSIGQVFGRFC